MTEVGKTNSQLPTFTIISTEHSYNNIFTCSARADISCLYSYSVVAQGNPRGFTTLYVNRGLYFPDDEIAAPISYIDFILRTFEYLSFKKFKIHEL